MAHRHDIQGLRGVAVLLVVFAHAGVRHLQGGYIGVDVFFVLSGYLITGLLLVKGVSLRDFYARRARRILPAAALTLVATDIAANHLLNFVRARDAVSDSIWAALFGANVHFAQQGSDYFNQGQPPSPGRSTTRPPHPSPPISRPSPAAGSWRSALRLRSGRRERGRPVPGSVLRRSVAPRSLSRAGRRSRATQRCCRRLEQPWSSPARLGCCPGGRFAISVTAPTRTTSGTGRY